MRIFDLLSKVLLIGCLAAGFVLNCCMAPAFGASIAVIDALGRTVRIPLPVRRIVSLNSDALEVLCILKAKGLVVGVDSHVARESRFWGDLAKKPKVGRWSEPNLEKIASLVPDLVVAYSRWPGQVLEKKMGSFKIPVLRLDCYKINTLEREVSVLGRILNRQKEASRFCKWQHLYIKKIHKKIARITRHTTVYVESYTDFVSCGPDSGGDEMCALAGGHNIATGLSLPYPRVTPEWVVSRNPDVIIKAAAYANGYSLKSPKPLNMRRDAILKRPAFSHVKAVKTGNVHVLDSSIWSGPRAIIGCAYMARWFYPKLFSDLNAEALHKEYFETFLGIPYQGIYVSK